MSAGALKFKQMCQQHNFIPFSLKIWKKFLEWKFLAWTKITLATGVICQCKFLQKVHIGIFKLKKKYSFQYNDKAYTKEVLLLTRKDIENGKVEK